MTTPFTKKFKKVFHLAISVIYAMQVKTSFDVSDLVKFTEKGLSTMAAIWPSTERVKICQGGSLSCLWRLAGTPENCLP
jgi:hypothetical protein